MDNKLLITFKVIFLQYADKFEKMLKTFSEQEYTHFLFVYNFLVAMYGNIRFVSDVTVSHKISECGLADFITSD